MGPLISVGVISETYNILFDKEGQYNVLEDLHIKLEKIEVGLDLTKVIDIQTGSQETIIKTSH